MGAQLAGADAGIGQPGAQCLQALGVAADLVLHPPGGAGGGGELLRQLFAGLFGGAHLRRQLPHLGALVLQRCCRCLGLLRQLAECRHITLLCVQAAQGLALGAQRGGQGLATAQDAAHRPGGPINRVQQDAQPHVLAHLPGLRM